MTEHEGSRPQSLKQHLDQSGVSQRTFYRHLKARQQDHRSQTPPELPLDTVQSSDDVPAGREDWGSESCAHPTTAQTIPDHVSSTTDRIALRMAWKQDTAAAASVSSSHQSQTTKKREHTSVACSTCRRRKTKCDGERPACKGCSTRELDCHYDHEPGEGRLPVLKRKFDALEAQSVDAYALLENLRTVPYEDAVQLLAQIRLQDVSFALQTSSSLQGTTATMILQSQGLPVTRPATGIEAQHTSDPVGAPAEGYEATTVYPNLDDIDPESTWTMAIDPYAC